MSSPLTHRARRYLADAARAFEQAPVEGAVALLLAVTFSYAVELGGAALSTWMQLLVASVLLLAGAWTGTLHYVRGAWSARARWAATFAGAAAAAVYGFVVPHLELEAEAWRAALLVAAALLWVVALPALGGPRAGAVDRVRDINGRFLLRVLGALLYTAALYAGLALALAAISNLFELDFEGSIYAHVWGWLFLVLAPSIVVGGLRDYVRPVAAPTAVAGAVHRMTAFLVPPLLALYYLILYAYTIRMAVTGEVPKNLLSPMVLAAGALGALTLYLFEPRTYDAAAARHLRYAPPLFLPLAALGMWAILLRVDQYGWTENRIARLVVLGVLAVLAIGASIQLAQRRRLALHTAPLVLAGALLLASIGPWSSLSLARRSQRARLAEVMQQAGITAAATDASTADTTRVIPASVYDELRDITRYLALHFGADALPPRFAVHVQDADALSDLPLRLGLRRAATPDERGSFRTAQLEQGEGVDVGGVRVQRVVLSPARRPPRPDGAPIVVSGAAGVTAAVIASQLRIRSGSEMLWVSLAGLIGLLGTAPAAGDLVELTPEQARLDVTDASGRRRGTLVIFSVNGRVAAGGMQLTGLDALLLLDTASLTER